MKKCMLVIVLAGVLSGRAEDLTRYVNVFTGTAATGHTTPAAACPFGMVQAGPDTGCNNWAYCSGYQYGDNVVLGYSQTHLNGTGCSDMGDVQILPFTGTLDVRPSRRVVDKRREVGAPGYYSTVQSDDGVKVEITATKHVGVYRITSLEGRSLKVLVNPAFGNGGRRTDRDVTCDVSVPGRIRGGYVRSSWVRNRPLFYAIEFSRAWTGLEKLPRQPGENQDAYVAEFGPEELTVRVALSQTSAAAAAANMRAETDGADFEKIRTDARAAWNALFARSVVEGDETQMKNWYTSLYHLYSQPNDFADVGVEPRFTTLSLWDTFRAAQPWYTIVAPEIVVPEINSLLGLYKRFGNLPRMSYGGGYMDCMIGEHSLSVIADAYLKGFRGFDERLALEAMVKTVTVPHKGREKENWETYEKYGYLPFDLVKYESCSRTLEQCFDDWCLAKYAEALGEKEIAARFFKRADNWKNIFDTSIGFARGKDSRGKWLEPFDPFAFGHETTVIGCFTEGNAFQYSWHVLHDVPGLVAAMGGLDKMAERLDNLFTAPQKKGFKSSDISGLIGQYVHGNEPSHHVIYFYPQIGRPEKAADRVREVFDRFYFPGPEGLSGNDDCGQMSAWYLFSAMGFYPFNPCGGEYVIGAPQVPRVEIEVEKRGGGGQRNKFTVIARGLSREDKYVKSVTLNGKPITDWKIRHADIMNGGELVFEMSKRNNDAEMAEGTLP
ncbi:MAG: GH92 family glycosyl hydrolase [bacterium]|nr:GH92 family glycosyl hydrolase [Candidatus Colisoma equi]